MHYVFLREDPLLLYFTAATSIIYNASILLMVTILSSRALFLEISFPLGMLVLTVLTMLVNNALSLRSQALLIMMVLWSMRLAFHLVIYNSKRPHRRVRRSRKASGGRSSNNSSSSRQGSTSTSRLSPLWSSRARLLAYLGGQTVVMALMGVIPAVTNSLPDRAGTVLFPFAEPEYLSVATFVTGMLVGGVADAIRVAGMDGAFNAAGERVSLPRKGLFTAALAPHYTGELITWLGMAMMPAIQTVRIGLWSGPFDPAPRPPQPPFLSDTRHRYYMAHTSTLGLGLPPLSSTPLQLRPRIGWSPLMYFIARTRPSAARSAAGSAAGSKNE